MLHISDHMYMALLDANLGADGSSSEGSDKVFYQPGHPLGGGGGVVDSGLSQGTAEND